MAGALFFHKGGVSAAEVVSPGLHYRTAALDQSRPQVRALDAADDVR